MGRISRITVEDIPYHVTQRGNGRQQVFFEAADYTLYLDLLRSQCEQSHLSVLAFCLLPNHVHLIVVPKRGRAMASALGRTHAQFARYYNLKKRACGHVWQARFFSTPLDGNHLWQAMAYVERNPVRAQLTKDAWQYTWSSAAWRLGMTHDHNWVERDIWQAEYDRERWKKVLATSVHEESFGERLREASRCGRPFGSGTFLEELETLCGRHLRTSPVGRPKKISQADQVLLAKGI